MNIKSFTIIVTYKMYLLAIISFILSSHVRSLIINGKRNAENTFPNIIKIDKRVFYLFIFWFVVILFIVFYIIYIYIYLKW